MTTENLPLKWLKEAHALIKDPKHWTQAAYARSRPNSPIPRHATSEFAACWCSVGAIKKVVPRQERGVEHYPYLEVRHLLEKGLTSLTGDRLVSIVTYNDNHTHAEVMEMWEEAIRLAEEKRQS